MAGPTPIRYRAFISYASVDRPIAERVQRAIERYRVPSPLRGLDRGRGPIPKRLTPLFRDRSDADASGNLGAALNAALEHSDALIVLCSPASARSSWVNAEIRRFKQLGRAGRIIPMLVGGRPVRFESETAADGAFPHALFERLDAAGHVAGADEPEPLAADISAAGDGFEFATLKVIAALTGVPLTELTGRQFEAERRERRIVRAVAATMAVLAIAAAIAAIVADRAADAARARLSSAIEMAARRVDDGARFGDEYGVPTEVIRQLLAGAERDFDALIGPAGAEAPVLLMQRGRLLTLFAGLYRATGDGPRQLARARDAAATLAAVPVARQWRRPRTWFATLPDATTLRLEQLGAAEALGLALVDAEGDTAQALRILEEGRDEAMAVQRWDYVARFWTRIGELLYNQGELAAATAAQDHALAALDRHLDAGTPDPLERSAVLSDRAELLLERERPAEALRDQSDAIAILEAQAAALPNDGTTLQSLGHALTRRADMRYALSGSWDGSIADLGRALALFERASAMDPARADYARDLSIGLERLGDVKLQAGDLAGAGALFERLIVIRRQRVTREPGNAEAHRDLAVGLERIADLELARRQPLRALAALDEARALRAAGAEADPVRARDLAVLWFKTASARLAAGGREWPAAYEAAIALMEPLLARQDAAPGWLRDVAVFRFGYGEALAGSGQRTAARRQWTGALALIDRQRQIAPDDPRLAEDRKQLLARLGRG